MRSEDKNVIELNGKMLQVDDMLTDFTIYEKPSSNVAYFGVNHPESKLFIQFKNGTSYIYADMPKILLDAAKVVESIGKFIGNVKDKPFEKYAECLVKQVEVLATHIDNGHDIL